MNINYTRILLALACVAALAGVFFKVSEYRSYRAEMYEPVEMGLVQNTAHAAQSTADFLTTAATAAERLATELSRGGMSEDALKRTLRDMIQSQNSFYGGTVAFKPYAWSDQQRLFAPYYSKSQEGVFSYLQIEDLQDYTQELWFSDAMTKGSRWSEPYYDDSVGDILMITYSAVFHEPASESTAGPAKGVVTVDLSMEAIATIVRSLDLGAAGYAMLLSSEGRFIYHPIVELVRSGKTASEVAQSLEDSELSKLLELLQGGQRGRAEYLSQITERPSWFVYEPVPGTGWTLVSVYAKDDVPIESTMLRRQLIGIVGWVLAFAIAFIAVGLDITRGERRRTWVASIAISLVLVAAIGYTWKFALDHDSETTNRVNLVNDPASLANYQDRVRQEAKNRLLDPPVFIPTGIFIDSAGFSEFGELSLRGRVWQRYDPSRHADIERGVTLAEAAFLTIGEPRITHLENGQEVQLWPLEATIRAHLDFTKYPLMNEQFRLRLEPVEANRRVMLVPDLSSYDILTPSARPGLDDNVYFAGWEIMRTFFEYQVKQLGTNFGRGSLETVERTASLYYNIDVTKNFMDAFISHLVPVIIAAIVVFFVLLIADHDSKRIKLMRTGVGFTLSMSATLLFVIVFSHIGMRQSIASEDIVYLEYFYIVMYLALVWVSVDAILLLDSEKYRFIHYQANLLAKVLFWPVILGVLWALTVATFY